MLARRLEELPRVLTVMLGVWDEMETAERMERADLTDALLEAVCMALEDHPDNDLERLRPRLLAGLDALVPWAEEIGAKLGLCLLDYTLRAEAAP